MHRLDFSHVHHYSTRDTAISLPVVLRSGSSFVDIVANVDTGASHCLFEASYAEQIGLQLISGTRRRFTTANSSFEAYGHEVEIDVLGVLTHSLVYFFADPDILKNVLGRSGWIDRIRLGLVDHDRTIYVAPYDLES